MESWRKVWREGVAPVLSTRGLRSLRDGLARDDVTLIQGATSSPPPLQCVLDWPCEGACLIGYAAWKGDGLATVGELEEFFAKTCFEADQRLGEPAVVRFLLNWYDDTPRDIMRREMLAEVDRELKTRMTPCESSPVSLPYASAATSPQPATP